MRTKEEIKEYSKRWYVKNRDRERQKRREYYKIYWPEKGRIKFWNRLYGLTKEDFDKILKKQNKRCAICGAEKSNETTGGVLSIDHNKSTRKIRGLLCHKCNMGIGCFKDDPLLLLKATKYLLETDGVK